MLVVTFGRAASQELRERVRAQLVEAERVLSDDPAARALLETTRWSRSPSWSGCCAAGTPSSAGSATAG